MTFAEWFVGVAALIAIYRWRGEWRKSSHVVRVAWVIGAALGFLYCATQWGGWSNECWWAGETSHECDVVYESRPFAARSLRLSAATPHRFFLPLFIVMLTAGIGGGIANVLANKRKEEQDGQNSHQQPAS